MTSRVVGTRAALCAHQKVLVANMIEVRTFNPNGFVGDIDATVDELTRFADGLARAPIKFAYANCAVAVVSRTAVGHIVVDDVGFAVIVKEEAGVDTTNLGQPYGVTPVAGLGIGSRYEEVAATIYQGCNHVEQLIGRVVGYRRSIYATRNADAVLQDELRRTIEDIAEALPVFEIRAVPNGHARIIDK